MAFPQRPEQLVLLWSFAQSCGARPLILGNGTNVLCPDEGLDRLVIDTSRYMNQVEEGTEPDTIRAAAGASLTKAAEFACRKSLSGLEFAHGIPGTVGGAVCMNAGAYGGEIQQVIAGASVLLAEEGIRFLSCQELQLGYRRSILTDQCDAVVLSAVFRLAPGKEEEIRQQMRELMRRRKEKQPLEWPSAGSTFKRPEGHFAGALIEGCGLKGFTIGGAQVSEKHAGFVINRGGATAADIRALMEQVQQIVLDRTGVSLEPEVKWIQ